MKKKEKKILKGEEKQESTLCHGCPVPYPSICSVCRGKNRWLVNQVIREMTECEIPLYIAL